MLPRDVKELPPLNLADALELTVVAARKPVIVFSAVVPTAIAERWFLPEAEKERHEDVRHPPLPAEESV